MDQKARHFRYYEQLNTLPVRPTISDTSTQQSADQGESNAASADHVVEMNAAGASNNVIAWEDWWQLKE